MIDIDYYPVRGDHLQIGDAFLWEGYVWIKLAGADEEDNNFPAFCLDPEVGVQGIVTFHEAGEPLTRVDLDIIVKPAAHRSS